MSIIVHCNITNEKYKCEFYNGYIIINVMGTTKEDVTSISFLEYISHINGWYN